MLCQKSFRGCNSDLWGFIFASIILHWLQTFAVFPFYAPAANCLCIMWIFHKRHFVFFESGQKRYYCSCILQFWHAFERLILWRLEVLCILICDSRTRSSERYATNVTYDSSIGWYHLLVIVTVYSFDPVRNHIAVLYVWKIEILSRGGLITIPV